MFVHMKSLVLEVPHSTEKNEKLTVKRNVLDKLCEMYRINRIYTKIIIKNLKL